MDRFAPLVARGLNVVAVLPLADLLDLAPSLSHPDFHRLVLVGSTGSAMWTSIERRGFADVDHPVDAHAADAVAAWRRSLEVHSDVVWPRPSTDTDSEAAPALPVMKLGERAGWGRRSPLGIGMHPRHGLWVGYRAVVRVAGTWPVLREPPAVHACDSCPDTPCVTRCPVSAIGRGKGILATPCFEERLRPGADCSRRCVSRLSCPVAPASRYPDAQVAHHQAFGNVIYHRWAATRVV